LKLFTNNLHYHRHVDASTARSATWSTDSPGVYPDPIAAKAALQAYAHQNGYAITASSSSARRAFYMCSKGGKYDPKGKDPTTHETKRRKSTSTMKTDCPYQAIARKDEVTSQWELSVINNDHNHGPVAAASAFPQHRIASMIPEEYTIVKDMSILGHSPSQILHRLRQSNPETQLIPRDIYNLLASLRTEELDGKTPVEWLLKVWKLVVSIYPITNYLSRNSKKKATIQKNMLILILIALKDYSFFILTLLHSSKSIPMLFSWIVHTKPTDFECHCSISVV
jgi:hypothetical protein